MGCSSSSQQAIPEIEYDSDELNQAIAKLLNEHNERTNVYIHRETRNSIRDSIWAQFQSKIDKQLNAVNPPLSQQTKDSAKDQFKSDTIDTFIDAAITNSENMISFIQFFENTQLDDLFIPLYGQNFIKLDLEKIPKKFRSALFNFDFKIESDIKQNIQIAKLTKYDVPYADFTKIDINPKTICCNNKSDEELDFKIYYRPNPDFSFKLLTNLNIDARFPFICDSLIIHDEFFTKLPHAILSWQRNQENGGVIQILCWKQLVITKNGTISVYRKGYSKGYGRGAGRDKSTETRSYGDYYKSSGGSYATNGRDGGVTNGVGSTYGDKELNYLWFGSPDGSGDRGGGIIEIISPKIINFGHINANGHNYGGSGGSIKIRCKDLLNFGKITANGGPGHFRDRDTTIDTEYNYGAGGDGRIAIYAENINNFQQYNDPVTVINNIIYDGLSDDGVDVNNLKNMKDQHIDSEDINEGHISPLPYIKKEKYTFDFSQHCKSNIYDVFTPIRQ